MITGPNKSWPLPLIQSFHGLCSRLYYGTMRGTIYSYFNINSRRSEDSHLSYSTRFIFYNQRRPRWIQDCFNTGSGFGFRVPVCGFRVPVVCNASLFCVVHWHITQHVWGGGGWAHHKESGTLQKRVTHYKKLVPETCKLVPETRNKNQCYCRPRWIQFPQSHAKQDPFLWRNRRR